MTHPGRIASALSLVALLLVLPRALSAQTVEGRLSSRGSGASVRGALVSLLDTGGGEAGSALSDTAGRYRLVARGAGTYRLRVERIGVATVTSPPFALGAGEVLAMPLVLPDQALSLQGLRVEARARCQVRPQGGRELARAWDEARKALRFTARTAADSLVAFEFVTWERELSSDGKRTRRDTSWVREAVGAVPFGSMPADSLVRGRFVQVHEDSAYVLFRGPDAATLLSDAFLDTHCFRLRRGGGERAGMIGLEFKPVPGTRGADVQGTLWLDERSSELRHLEFRYTGLSAASPDRMGGRADFFRLPTGAWMVRNWYLRWPIADMRYDGPRRILTIGRIRGLRESGGTVTAVRGAEGAR